MTPWGTALSNRVFPRVLSRAGSSRSVVAVHPRRRLGGAGGPAAPFRGARGDTPLDKTYLVIYGPKWTFSPLSRGVQGGPHKSLLDLLVRTDTEGVSLGGSKGSPLYPYCCEVCCKPFDLCVCRFWEG